MTAVILPIHNEAFFLPWWLRHHVPLFDRGIVLDDSCTDGSIDIVRELAPDWEIIKSRRSDADEEDLTRELEDVEQSISGRKVILQATEFLATDDLSPLDAHEHAVGFGTVVMVDPTPGGPPMDPLRPLWDQPRGSFGYEDPGWEYVREGREVDFGRGARYSHCAPRGEYTVGRHRTRLPHGFVDWPRILWYGWAPWPEVKPRRLQFAARVSSRDRARGWNFHHLRTPEQLEADYLEHRNRAGPVSVLP